jgi:hypothetical protein
MFELKDEEFRSLRSQIVTSSWGGSRYIPMVFTARPLSCCRLPVAGFFSKPFKIIIHELELFEVGY